MLGDGDALAHEMVMADVWRGFTMTDDLVMADESITWSMNQSPHLSVITRW